MATSESSTVALDLERVRDLRGRAHHPWARRIVLLLMVALVGVALSGALGQSERVRHAESPTARVDLRLPGTLRGGLMWSSRVTVRAKVRIADPRLVLGAGYVDGMQLNTVEPAPADEASNGDSIALTYATLEPGDRLTVYLQSQVDPDTVPRAAPARPGPPRRPPRPREDARCRGR